jgi:pimeloyl-ACP methyl ester carboxylesterase
MVDGLYENSLSYQLSRRFVMTYAQKQIDTGNDIREWEKIIEYYEQHPTIELGDLFKHSQYVDKANGYYYTEKPIEGSLGLFNSPRSGLAELYNSRYVGKKNVKGILGGLDISDQLQNITVPTLVLWGRHDGILPAPLAQEYYSKLGTPDSQKSLVIFEESAHSPMFEEPAKFASEVILFINRNK